jgi:hypothetical protein
LFQKYFAGGGLLLVDDASGEENSSFIQRVKKELKRIFPYHSLEPISPEHALFYSFYLKPKVSGLELVYPYLEGLAIKGRLCVIISYNNLGGALAKTPTGEWLSACIPGGEAQRLEAIKLIVNIILYTLTGTYKKDAIHQPFIKKKLGE